MSGVVTKLTFNDRVIVEISADNEDCTMYVAATNDLVDGGRTAILNADEIDVLISTLKMYRNHIKKYHHNNKEDL